MPRKKVLKLPPLPISRRFSDEERQEKYRRTLVLARASRNARLRKITGAGGYLKGLPLKKAVGKNVVAESQLRVRAKKFKILLEESGRIIDKLGDSFVGTGLDEGLRTSEAGAAREKDSELKLNECLFNFAKMHLYLRFPTHSFIHTDVAGRETNSHVGSLFKAFPLGKITQKTSGSLGTESVHEKRQKIVKEVMEDSSMPPEYRPICATVKVVAFMIDNTLGYKDRNRKDIVFSGIHNQEFD